MTQDSFYKKKIGIMGGTFDPIHYGHLMLAENALTQFSLDQILFIPTGYSPHKRDDRITSSEQRCEMIQRAIHSNPKFQLSLREIEAKQVSYTYKTLVSLKQESPDTEIYFIMGGDSLYNFETWKKPDVILQNASILVAVRDDLNMEQINDKIAYLTDKYKGNLYPLNTPNFSVSSNNIRKRVLQGQSIRYLLPEEVRD